MNGVTDLANDIKARRKERERAAEDRADRDAAEAIVSARAELPPAVKAVKEALAAAEAAQAKYDKAIAAVNKADNWLAELRDMRIRGKADLDFDAQTTRAEADLLKLRHLRDGYGRRCMEVAALYANALQREGTARAALAAAEAVLTDGT